VGETKIARRALLQTSCLGLVVAAEAFGLAQMARAAGDYRLSTGDKIRITIVGEEQGSGIYEVDSTGSISTGLIGRVSVQGIAVGEVELMLVDLYRSKRILLDPRISVEAISLMPFFILGEVEKRGSYPYMLGLTVAQAVALAGGYTYRATRSRITVQRQGASEERATEDWPPSIT
jgi:polysaccharide export outer membrane protein